MDINGRPIRFYRNVYANCMVCDATADGDTERFLRENIVNVENYSNSQKACAVMMEALSCGYEYSRQIMDSNYKPHPLTQREALLLPTETFNALFAEALRAWRDDGKVTIETDPPKGKKTAKPEK